MVDFRWLRALAPLAALWGKGILYARGGFLVAA